MMTKKKQTEKQDKWEHLAVRPENKKRFDFLKTFLATREKPDVTQDELLVDMMNLYEENKKPERQ